MKKLIAAALLIIILIMSVAGCSPQTTTQTVTQTTTESVTLTVTPTATRLTNDQVALVVMDYLSGMAKSSYAKGVLADFYDNFNDCAFDVWDNSSNADITVYNDTDLSAVNFDAWQYSLISLSNNSLPVLFTQIFNPQSNGTGPWEDTEGAIALRWLVDSHTGKVTTMNPNALRLEAELIK